VSSPEHMCMLYALGSPSGVDTDAYVIIATYSPAFAGRFTVTQRFGIVSVCPVQPQHLSSRNIINMSASREARMRLKTRSAKTVRLIVEPR